MNRRALLPALTLILCSVPAAARAQNPVPTAQPAILTIYREEVKYGHGAEHEAVEAGWPAAYTKAKSPYTYIAITSMTGPSEAWFMSAYPDYKAYGESWKMDSSDPALRAELARLSKADAQHVNSGRSLHLVGRPELSSGAFPSIANARFYEVTYFRVRPGHEHDFENLAKMFKAAYAKAAPETSYRFYQVVAGMPGSTYMAFSTVPALADLDKARAIDAAVMGSLSAEQIQALQKFSQSGLINTETQRFAVNGRMSYVDDATAAQDPAFWRPAIKAAR